MAVNAPVLGFSRNVASDGVAPPLGELVMFNTCLRRLNAIKAGREPGGAVGTGGPTAVSTPFGTPPFLPTAKNST